MRLIAVAAFAVSLAACAGTNMPTTPSAVVATGQALTGLPSDGVLCSSLNDVDVFPIRDEQVEFTNASTCIARVGLGSFFDPFYDVRRQTNEDYQERYLAPGEKVVVWVRLPRYDKCGETWDYQVDAVLNLTPEEGRRSPHPVANLLWSVRNKVVNAACPGDETPNDPPAQSHPPPAMCDPAKKDLPCHQPPPPVCDPRGDRCRS